MTQSWSRLGHALPLAPATQTDYEQCWQDIEPILGKCTIASLRSTDIARYMRVERAAAPSRANHEKALLSNLFFHGIDLGLCADDPARLVRPNVEEPRTLAPQPALLAAFVAWARKQSPQRRIVTLAARYASLGGSRKAEFLDLAWPQVDRDAGQIRTKRAKQRGKKRGEVIDVVAISPALVRSWTNSPRCGIRTVCTSSRAGATAPTPRAGSRPSGSDSWSRRSTKGS